MKTRNAGENNQGAKLSLEAVKVIRHLLNCGHTGKEITEVYGLSKGLVSAIKNNKLWKGSEESMEALPPKTCTDCGELKPSSAFGWRCKGTDREYQEVRCKKCRSAANNRFNMLKREEAAMAVVLEESPCPCDSCWKSKTCEVECVSFKCWVETGV
jgi:hypothetical protein